MPLRKSGKLIVPALLRSSDEHNISDPTPQCRLHFSICPAANPQKKDGQVKFVEKDLQKKGFLPRGAYDHLCAALLMWSQRTTDGWPNLKQNSMKIRLSKRALVRRCLRRLIVRFD